MELLYVSGVSRIHFLRSSPCTNSLKPSRKELRTGAVMMSFLFGLHNEFKSWLQRNYLHPTSSSSSSHLQPTSSSSSSHLHPTSSSYICPFPFIFLSTHTPVCPKLLTAHARSIPTQEGREERNTLLLTKISKCVIS
uniref:Uncharacterized protein n=2 Tax=Cacopsylla melanoneura TaxID=428564 RepID=A0A8D8XQD2_9HEMI